jgi:hypothetical protein
MPLKAKWLVEIELGQCDKPLEAIALKIFTEAFH